MAFTNKSIPGNYVDDEGYDEAVTNVVQYDVNNATGRLVAIKCDNSAVGATTWLRLYDLGVGVTLGMTAIHMLIPVPASTNFEMLFLTDAPNFATAVDIAAVAVPGESLTTAPGSAVPVRLLTT
jgi:hypothetical protein